MIKVLRKTGQWYDTKIFLWLIFSLAIFLRITQYLFNRSLWLDEASLALNIVNRSFLDLFQPLDYSQGAPIGFLLVEKVLAQGFGNSEYVLRLFPLLSSLISPFLFYKVAKHFIEDKAIPIALILFAISNSLIYYASEVKQYSSDVAITLLLYITAISMNKKKNTLPRIALFGLTGGIAIWFSYPSAFILAAIAASSVLISFNKKEWAEIGRLALICMFWLSSFTAFYFISLNNLSHNNTLLNYWTDSFITFPPTSIWHIKSLFDMFLSTFKNPLDFSLKGLAAFTFIAGLISFFKGEKKLALYLTLPIVFVLIASAMHLYPFKGRLLLFMVPIYLLFISEGLEQIRLKESGHFSYLVYIIIILLVYQPLFNAGYHLINPRTREEIKLPLNFIKEHRQKRDLIYVYYGAERAFNYYSKYYDIQKKDVLIGTESRNKWSNYKKDIDQIYGNPRVWILFSHIWEWNGVNEKDLYLYYLNTIGKKKRSFKASGAEAYLYDLSG